MRSLGFTRDTLQSGTGICKALSEEPLRGALLRRRGFGNLCSRADGPTDYSGFTFGSGLTAGALSPRPLPRALRGRER